MNVENRLNRQEIIRLAIQFAGAKNENMPSHVRRILAQKFKIEVSELEAECECDQLAADTLPQLARLASLVEG